MYLSTKNQMIRESGFTLIEAIMVISITGIIAAVVAVFIAKPVQGYADTVRRAKMTEEADISLRFIARELHASLPNSITCTSSASSGTLSFLPIRSGGRYREQQTGGNSGTPLQFGTSISQFDTIGGTGDATQKDAYGQAVSSGTAAVGNLGGSVAACDATTTPQNTLAVSSLASGVVSITADTVPLACSLQLATANSRNDRVPGRFYMIAPALVSYACGPTGLTRNAAKLSDRVNACQISCASTDPIAQTITILLTLTDSGESMTLLRQILVENYP